MESVINPSLGSSKDTSLPKSDSLEDGKSVQQSKPDILPADGLSYESKEENDKVIFDCLLLYYSKSLTFHNSLMIVFSPPNFSLEWAIAVTLWQHWRRRPAAAASSLFRVLPVMLQT